MKSLCFISTIFVLVSMAPRGLDAAPPTKDVVFATVDNHELKLDLFLPERPNILPWWCSSTAVAGGTAVTRNV